MDRGKVQNRPKQDPTIKEVWDTLPEDVKKRVRALRRELLFTVNPLDKCVWYIPERTEGEG